jgi:amino-acid N-acetyltransferase
MASTRQLRTDDKGAVVAAALQEKPVLCIEPARMTDAEDIHKLVAYWADRGEMLHRPLGEVYEAIRDFKVGRLDGRFVGCGSLHIMGADLAEIRSLAVAEEAQGRQVGAGIVRACLDDARAFGLDRVFALTYKPEFFAKLGFRVANVMEFPQKVWNECVRCPFFTNCKEVAVVIDLKGADLSVPLAR